MLQLAWGLCLVALLGWDSAVLAAEFRRPAAVFPLPLLSAGALSVYLLAMPGFLRAGVFVTVTAWAAPAVWGAVRLRREALRQLTESSGLMLFLGGAALLWIVLFCLQPMFFQWDEFTAWGLAPKMVVQNGCFYAARPGNLKASFTYPATSVVTVLFEPFARWSEWACMAALDTLAMACLAAASALPGDRRTAGVAVFACGFVLPYFFADTPAGSYAGQYANAMADLPLFMLFGGSLCLYFALGGKGRAYWLTALPLMLLTLTKDICFAYGLIAVFIIGLDLWLAGDKGPRKGFLPALGRALPLAVAVVLAFVSWGRYTAAVTPLQDTAAAVGSEGLSYGAVLLGGVRQLLGIGREEKFAALMSLMFRAFFTRKVCLLGSGAAAVACLTLTAAAAWFSAEKGPARRRVVVVHLGLAFCFAALYLFHLILYNYNFAESEALALKGYDRYLTPYYQAWMLALLALLGQNARSRRGAGALCAVGAAVLGIFAWRGVPAAGFWSDASTRYTVRQDVQAKAAALNPALTVDDKVLVISQGDDATRWYYYRYELTGTVADGFSGSYTEAGDTALREKGDFMNLVAADSTSLYPCDNTVCTPEALIAYMQEIGCEYLLLDRSDGYLAQAFSPYFAGGLQESMPATLYRFVGEQAAVPFVPAAQESGVAQ